MDNGLGREGEAIRDVEDVQGTTGARQGNSR